MSLSITSITKSGQMAEALWVPWILLPGQSTRTLAMAPLSIIFEDRQTSRSDFLLPEPTSNGHGLAKMGVACKIFVHALHASVNMKPPEWNPVSATDKRGFNLKRFVHIIMTPGQRDREKKAQR